MSVWFAALFGCAATPEDAVDPALAAEPITNGQLAGPAYEEMFGLVHVNTTVGRCSGSAIQDRWIVTAAHCGTQPNDTVTFLGQTFTVDAAFNVEPGDEQQDDLAVFRLSSPLLRPNGSPWSPTADVFGTTYPTEPRVFADNFTKVLCFGASTGVYLSGSFTCARGTSRELVELKGSGPNPPQIARGDSGGPCFRFDTGSPQYVGLNDLIAHTDPDGSTSDGQLLAFTQSKVDWIAGRLATKID